MSDIADLERRITAALERISRGLDAAPVPAQADAPGLAAKDAEIARLTAALAEEKAASAKLAAQVADLQRAPREKAPLPPAAPAAIDDRIDRMTRQLDVQGLELQRMRKTAVALREQLRVTREALAASLPEPQLINKAMLAELEALRATRLTEMAEIDGIISELTPLIEEAAHA
jgi:chromosome segregation ATPase